MLIRSQGEVDIYFVNAKNVLCFFIDYVKEESNWALFAQSPVGKNLKLGDFEDFYNAEKVLNDLIKLLDRENLGVLSDSTIFGIPYENDILFE